MADEETPTPPRDDAPGDGAETAPVIGAPDVPAGSAPAEDAPSTVTPPWASPVPLASDRPRTPRARPASGGWLGRLRALVGAGEPPAAPPPPPAAPARAPGPAEAREEPAVPVFEAPPRPALLDTPPALEAPARTAANPPATPPSPATPTSPPPVAFETSPAKPSAWRFGQPPADTPPRPAATPAAEPAADHAPDHATDPPIELGATGARPPEDAAPEPLLAGPPAAPHVEPEIAPQAEADAAPQAEPEIAPQAKAHAAPQAEPEIAPQAEADAVPQAEPEIAPQTEPQGEAETEPDQVPEPVGQPSLFHTPPAEPQSVVAEFAPLPTLDETVEAIEEAIEEAEALLEHPPAETPEERAFPPVPPLTALAEDLPLLDPDAQTPEEVAEEQREAEVIAKGGPFSRFAWPSHPHYWNGYLAVITGLVTLSFLMFVLVEPSPRWILLLVALGVAAGMDGVLRATWRAAFATGEDTTPYLVLPALYVFAAPLLIEHNVTGHAVIWWALVAGIGFGAIAVAEVLSVRTGSRLYPYARMVTTGSAYFTAFSLLSLTYVLDVRIVPAFVATGLIGAMLAIEVVREGEVDPMETAIFAGLAGLVLAQVRWLLYFLPVDGYLAGLTLVLTFYFVTGVLHSYVLRQLNLITGAEYALVATIGMVLVGAARVAGLA